MYFEYWHLHKPPFDNVPDPSMYAECHTSMENAIAETLFAVEEGNECLAVIIGDVGLGKTLSLRIIIDSLSPEKYQLALITNPSITFVQLLNEIIGQLTESPCNEKRKVALLEIFNKLLFQKAEAGKKIVLLIDEANAITPASLESLRLLTNMQDDRRNLFTMVLAGQIELARRLEDPKRANFFQRIGTYSQIEKIASDQLRNYVETRLRLAGGVEPIFSEDTYPLFWKYSEQGVPRLINKIAKLSLKAGETYGLEQVDAQVVYQVGRQFEKITTPAASRGNAKKKKEEPVFIAACEPQSYPRSPEPAMVEKGVEEPAREGLGCLAQPRGISNSVPAEAMKMELALKESFSAGPASREIQELMTGEAESSGSLLSLPSSSPQSHDGGNDYFQGGMEIIGKPSSPEWDQASGSNNAEEMRSAGLNSGDFKATEPSDERSADSILSEVSENSPLTPQGLLGEIQMGNFKIQLNLPSQFVEQALSSNQETRVKMAGQVAAQAIKNHSQLTSSPAADPFSIWSELRSIILERLDQTQSGMAA